MGRNKKTEAAKTEEPVVNVEIEVEEPTIPSKPQSEAETSVPNDIKEVEEAPKKSKTADEISSRDAELMRLYPQYEEIWITPDGFVHPKGASAFLLKGAKLYKNKFYNK